jgi:hypothetical protein
VEPSTSPTATTSKFAVAGRPEVEPAPAPSARHVDDLIKPCGTVGWREYQVRAARSLSCAAALAAARAITKDLAGSGWACSYKVTPKVRHCQRGSTVRFASATLFIAQVRFASTALPWPDPRDV